jgi:hypothetical protein
MWVWHSRERAEVRLLLWLYLIPALVLSFGFKQRIFYILPAVAPMVLLYAAALTEWARCPLISPLWRWLVPVHAGVLLLLLTGLFWQVGHAIWQLWAMLAVIIVLTALGVKLVWRRPARPAVIGVLGVMFAALLALLGPAPVGWWSDQRYEQAELSAAALAVLQPEDKVAIYRFSARAFVYYLRRPVQEIDTPPQVQALAERGTHYLIVPREFVGVLDGLPGSNIVYASPRAGALALRLVKLESYPTGADKLGDNL